MIGAVALAVLCLYVSFRIGLRMQTPGPKIERRRSRRPIRGDLWLWEQETRRGSDL